MLTNGTFWIGVLAGVAAHIAWQRYQMRKAAQ